MLFHQNTFFHRQTGLTSGSQSVNVGQQLRFGHSRVTHQAYVDVTYQLKFSINIGKTNLKFYTYLNDFTTFCH